jgi:hypothetical protein
MSYALKPSSDSKLQAMQRRRGTNTVESSNKQVNNAASDVTRMRGGYADALVLLRVHEHNIKKDKALRGVPQAGVEEAKEVCWWIDEENAQHASTLPNLDEAASSKLSLYPPSQPEDYMSLSGLLF